MIDKKRLILAGTIALIVTIISIISIQKNKVPVETNIQTEEKKTQIMIYFPNKETEELQPEYRFVSIDEIKEDMIGTIIKELIKGPNSNNLKKISENEINLKEYQENKNKITVKIQTEETENETIKKAIEKSLKEIKEIEEVEIEIIKTD